MFGVDSFLTFIVAAVVLTVSPGPDSVYIVSRTVAQGRLIGFLSFWGIYCGAATHVLAAAFGLTAILATSALAFSIVKYVGAAYLIWLGIQALRSKGMSLVFDGPVSITSPWKVFGQGILVNLLNPKMALFFMSFLPQFVDPSRGGVFLQIVLLGLTTVAVGIIWDAFLVMSADRIAARLRGSRRFTRWMDRVLGSVFVGLGLRLAMQER